MSAFAALHLDFAAHSPLNPLKTAAKEYRHVQNKVERGARIFESRCEVGDATVCATYLSAPAPRGAKLIDFIIHDSEYGDFTSIKRYAAAAGRDLADIAGSIRAAIARPNLILDVTQNYTATLEDGLLEVFAKLTEPLSSKHESKWYGVMAGLKRKLPKTYGAVLLAKANYLQRHGTPHKTLQSVVRHISEIPEEPEGMFEDSSPGFLKRAGSYATAGLLVAAGVGALLSVHEDDWTANAESDVGWQEGEIASQIAEELGVSDPDLEDLLVNFQPEEEFDDVVLSDNFVLLTEDVLYGSPGNVTAYNMDGKPAAKFLLKNPSSLSSILGPLFPGDAPMGDKIVYCSPENKTLLGNIASNTNRTLIDGCGGLGFLLSILLDNSFMVTSANESHPNNLDYFIFDASGTLLGRLPWLGSNGSKQMYVFVGPQKNNLLFEFWNSPNKPSNVTLKAFDINSRQVRDVAAPADMPSVATALYVGTAKQTDEQGNLNFVGWKDDSLRLYKYDGAQVTQISAMQSDYNLIVWSLKNNLALVSYLNLSDILKARDTVLLDFANSKIAKSFGAGNLFSGAFFDGRRLLRLEDSDDSGNNLTQYDVATDRSVLVDNRTYGFDPLTASRFIFEGVNKTGPDEYGDYETNSPLFFVDGNKAIRLSSDTGQRAINKNMIVWSNETGVYILPLQKAIELVNGTILPPPPKPKQAPLFVPKIVYDSRPDGGSQYIFDKRLYFGNASLDAREKDFLFYYPVFPRSLDKQFKPHSQSSDICVSTLEDRLGDDDAVSNNHEYFDSDFSVKYDRQSANIVGAPAFSAASCVPVFYKVFDYGSFEVQEFLYYRAFSSGFGPLTKNVTHEHDYQAALVWVNKTTGKPFHFAVREQALPFVDNAWIQKDVKNESELVAYAQWRSAGLGLVQNPNPPFWRDGLGPVISKEGGGMFNGVVLYDRKAIEEEPNHNVDKYGLYNTNEQAWLSAKSNNVMSPWLIAPWLIPELNDPDKITAIKPKNLYLTYISIDKPAAADLSFILNNKSSDKTSWQIPQSAVNGEVGYLLSNQVAIPTIKLNGETGEDFNITGHVIGIGNGLYQNFTLRHLHARYGDTINVTPNWTGFGGGSIQTINIDAKIGNKTTEFITLPDSDFSQAIKQAQRSDVPEKRARQPVIVVPPSWMLAVLLGATGVAAAVKLWLELRRKDIP